MENNNQVNTLNMENNVIEENGKTVKILIEENEKHQNIINELKLENKLLEKKSNIATNESFDNLIMITEIESENEEMQKESELLHFEIKQKDEQIDILNNIQKQKDVEISQIKAQKSQISESISKKDQFSNEVKEIDVYLVELNYLKAKGLLMMKKLKP